MGGRKAIRGPLCIGHCIFRLRSTLLQFSPPKSNSFWGHPDDQIHRYRMAPFALSNSPKSWINMLTTQSVDRHMAGLID
jgi:hypothetical protein